MKQKQSIVRILMAAVIMFGVETTANAQFGKLKGLANKAKSAVKDKAAETVKVNANNTVGDVAGESESTSSSSSSSSSKHPQSLKQLSAELFKYLPADKAENAPFFDVNNANVTKGYVDFCNVANHTESEGRHVPYEQLDFVDYQTSNGVKQVHITEFPLTAYYAYFMTNPKEVSGYQCYIRARLMQDLYRFDKVGVYPYEQHPKQGWKEVYPGAKNQRNITLKDGRTISLMETETDRQRRWDNVQGEAEDILHANTPYNVIRAVLKGTLDAAKQCDAAGRMADACNLFREAGYMYQDLASHPFKSKDEQFQDINEDYQTLFKTKRLAWLKAAGAAQSTAVDMPKGVTVPAQLQNVATQKAASKFGAKFVKAIFTESEWHEYKSKEYPYPIDHRSMDVDVIIKEGNEYYVSHQCLWQNYSDGKYTTYDLRNSQAMNRPIQQKVNYK